MHANFARMTLTPSVLLLSAAIASAAKFSVVHDFGDLSVSTGFNPRAPLVQGPDGTLYGTTSLGEGSSGTIFKINADGTGFTVLKYLTNSAEGNQIRASLVLSGNTLYGAAAGGGAGNSGTLFRMNTDGTGFTNIHTFTARVSGQNSDGAVPRPGMTISGNTLYGTTANGGTASVGNVFKVNTDGSGFTVLVTFGNLNGANPQADLILSGATLYGTTLAGGSGTNGTVFKI